MFAYLRRGPASTGGGRSGRPMILQNLITSTLAMADTFMVGMLGEAPMAGVTLANIPIFVVQLFFFGVQSGSTVLISQYWGKGDREAINRVIGVALWAVNLVSVAFALVLLLFPVPSWVCSATNRRWWPWRRSTGGSSGCPMCSTG